jgi:hypothetical protein
MLELLKPDAIVNYYYYSKDIFKECEACGVAVITLDHWAASRKG